MAKWWDERADYYRELSQNRNYPPAPARQAAPAPPTTVRVWDYDHIRRDEFYNDFKWASTSTTTYTTSTFYDQYSIQQMARPIVDEFRYMPPPRVREVNETDWFAPQERHVKMVIGCQDPDPSRADWMLYMHTSGRLSREDMMRVLSRYWNTEEKVRKLFGGTVIDVLHPREDQCTRYGSSLPIKLRVGEWEMGTLSSNVLQWRDGRWWKRNAKSAWEIIDPEKPE